MIEYKHIKTEVEKQTYSCISVQCHNISFNKNIFIMFEQNSLHQSPSNEMSHCAYSVLGLEPSFNILSELEL